MSFGQDKDEDAFNIVNSYFIGPKAANLPDFRANINTILDELLETRLNYYPEDNVCSSIPLSSFKAGKISLAWAGAEIHYKRSPKIRKIRQDQRQLQ